MAKSSIIANINGIFPGPTGYSTHITTDVVMVYDRGAYHGSAFDTGIEIQAEVSCADYEYKIATLIQGVLSTIVIQLEYVNGLLYGEAPNPQADDGPVKVSMELPCVSPTEPTNPTNPTGGGDGILTECCAERLSRTLTITFVGGSSGRNGQSRTITYRDSGDFAGLWYTVGDPGIMDLYYLTLHCQADIDTLYVNYTFGGMPFAVVVSGSCSPVSLTSTILLDGGTLIVTE